MLHPLYMCVSYFCLLHQHVIANGQCQTIWTSMQRSCVLLCGI